MKIETTKTVVTHGHVDIDTDEVEALIREAMVKRHGTDWAKAEFSWSCSWGVPSARITYKSEEDA